MDCDSFVLSIRNQNVNTTLKNLEGLFDLSNLGVNHENFSNKNKKFVGQFKTEIRKNSLFDESNCLK